nr:hypothetical protein [Tanacetum cinerariifolium]
MAGITVSAGRPASGWATYRFLDGPLSGFRLGGGVRYFDNTFAYTSPTLYGKLKTGDVTLVDALVGYDIDKHWSVDVNAKNLFDKEYVSGCNNAGAIGGYDGREGGLSVIPLIACTSVISKLTPTGLRCATDPIDTELLALRAQAKRGTLSRQ